MLIMAHRLDKGGDRVDWDDVPWRLTLATGRATDGKVIKGTRKP
jgi:hypothetical protein